MKIYSLKILNGKCPFCTSKEICKGILSYGIGGGSSSKLPDPNIEVWHCASCKKAFEVIKEKWGDWARAKPPGPGGA